jgi:ABC-2 type transport system ATP-binding protein
MRSLSMTTSSSDAIYVEDLEKRFGKFVAVNKISFSVKKGEIFGFLGPNGSGKSTTIRMLCGILTPTSGKGFVAGYDIVKEPENIKESIGYMSQKFSLYGDMSPRENIRFYLGIYDVPLDRWEQKMDWILDLTRLTEVSNRLTRELPPGWRPRLALGCGLLLEPHKPFLD